MLASQKKFKVVAPSFVLPPPTAVVVPAGEGYGSRRRGKKERFSTKVEKKGKDSIFRLPFGNLQSCDPPLRPLSHKTHFSGVIGKKGGRKECGH